MKSLASYKLKNFNNFTDTSPAFRANLKIYLDKGGFSSYQSEYPYNMITKRGSVVKSSCFDSKFSCP